MELFFKRCILRFHKKINESLQFTGEHIHVLIISNGHSLIKEKLQTKHSHSHLHTHQQQPHPIHTSSTALNPGNNNSYKIITWHENNSNPTISIMWHLNITQPQKSIHTHTQMNDEWVNKIILKYYYYLLLLTKGNAYELNKNMRLSLCDTHIITRRRWEVSKYSKLNSVYFLYRNGWSNSHL